MPAIAASADEEYDIRKGISGIAYRLFIGFGVLALLSVAILIAGKLYGRSLVHAGHTSATQRFQVTIDGDTVSAPANMIRIEAQRRDGPSSRLDLYVHWPTLSGFRDNLARAFNDIEPATNSIVFASLLQRATTADMAGRFDAVYRNVMVGPITDAGDGLMRARLSPEHGYVDEYVVFGPPDRVTGRRFVVRCQDAEATAQTVVAPCETEIHLGETLTAEIRFPLRLLGDWRELNAELPAFLDSLLVGQGRP
ncbi:hypothetical protein [Oricola sp.]|uniref:hypothetical protein n=1 Tax=Oricola sp. TaxID=1979950 RepID=UPI0025E326D9|nr:hypothetical protein [Oricola sp.]MCI5077026.1 hypothetical protein [Oricola sp.]